MIEKEDAQLIDVIGHVITLLDLHLEGIITRSLFIYVCVYLYKGIVCSRDILLLM